jgi:hypothetical protein
MEKGDNFIARVFKSFKKPMIDIKKDDIGVYHDELCLYMYNDDSNNTVKHKIFAKVIVLGVYSDLVEIDVVGEINIPESTSNELTNLISKNFPKYVNPKHVSWQKK